MTDSIQPHLVSECVYDFAKMRPEPTREHDSSPDNAHVPVPQLTTALPGFGHWARLEELQERYQNKCPECGNRFWITPDQIKTSWVDGSIVGYRCPKRGCQGVAAWDEEKQ